MRTIAVCNQSTVVAPADFAAAVAAVQRQVAEHVSPSWGLTCIVQAVPTPQVGVELIHVLDDSDQADALGYHEIDATDVPVGYVFAKTSQDAGDDWRVTLSHELLEQLADPWVYATAVAKWKGRPAVLALEVCDPVEDDTYTIDGVPVSNFVLPLWFEAGKTPPGAHFDWLGKLAAPLTMTKGGYVSYSTTLRSWQQSFGEKHTHTHGPHSRPVRRVAAAKARRAARAA